MWMLMLLWEAIMYFSLIVFFLREAVRRDFKKAFWSLKSDIRMCKLNHKSFCFFGGCRGSLLLDVDVDDGSFSWGEFLKGATVLIVGSTFMDILTVTQVQWRLCRFVSQKWATKWMIHQAAIKRKVLKILFTVSAIAKNCSLRFRCRLLRGWFTFLFLF